MSTHNICFHGEIKKIYHVCIEKSVLHVYNVYRVVMTPFCYGTAHILNCLCGKFFVVIKIVVSIAVCAWGRYVHE